jgi:catechol 2,3-dioxygenase-like lactoylglutathione lyase family enzyme
MKSIEIVAIPVSSQAKSKSFYQNVGFRMIVESPMGNGQTWVQLGLPDQTTSISLMETAPGVERAASDGTLQGIVLETEDIEKEIQELKKKGIEAGKIDNTPWGKFSFFKDPDGNGLTLHQK